MFPFSMGRVRQDTAVVRINDVPYNFPAVQIRPRPNPELINIATNASGALSGYTRIGKGHIGFQLIQETYRLMLSGDSIAYGTLWSPLIGHVARARARKSMITIDTPLPYYIDEPVDMNIVTGEESPSLLADSLDVALMEHPILDGLWSASIWHSRAGWHTVSTKTGDSLNYYVFHQSEWRNMRKARQQQENKRLSNREPGANASKMNDEEEYPQIIFYLLFLISAGFLWLAPKL
jgi:hypothetical protein